MADNVLSVLFQDIADAIRAKTGAPPTDTMKPNEFPTEIRNIPVGGGSSADVRYVTFIGADGTVLYKKPVAVGDDCVDVAAKGLISTPTKESTVAEVYTYSGWSITEGGEADADALKNVTADRTVYAAFTVSARLYTITYYDGDTVLHTEQLPYGAMPSYVPEKSGYICLGYNPELAEVTSDASYAVIFEVAQDFANASWDFISRVSKTGQAASVFKLGDERTETLTWSDGTTEQITFQIGQIYQTETEDGTKVITLVPKQLLSKQSAWGLDSRFGWRKDYALSDLKTFLEGTVLTGLPNELQAVLQTADTKAILGFIGNSKHYYKIAPLRHSEIGYYESGNEITDASQLPPNTIYGFGATQASRVRKDPSGVARSWWITAEVTSYTSGAAPYMQTNGKRSTYNSQYTAYVLFKIFV